MTPLDALTYPQFLFYNALDLTTPSFLSYPLVPPPISRFQSPQLFIADNSDRNKQGRAYNPGRPLSMSDRERILQLYEKGHKISHIARMIGVTHSCVSKIMTRYRRTGSMYPRSYSTGLLTSGRNSFDLAESASDCGASTTSEEWIAAESPASSYPSQTAEEPSKSSFAPEHPDKVREDVVVTPTTTLRAKISAYSIERLLA